METLYHYIGYIVLWTAAGALAVFCAYWSLVFTVRGATFLRKQNFVAFYVFRDTLTTSQIRELYGIIRDKYSFAVFTRMSRKHGRYAAKYRKRNIDRLTKPYITWTTYARPDEED